MAGTPPTRPPDPVPRRQSLGRSRAASVRGGTKSGPITFPRPLRRAPRSQAGRQMAGHQDAPGPDGGWARHEPRAGPETATLPAKTPFLPKRREPDAKPVAEPKGVSGNPDDNCMGMTWRGRRIRCMWIPCRMHAPRLLVTHAYFLSRHADRRGGSLICVCQDT